MCPCAPRSLEISARDDQEPADSETWTYLGFLTGHADIVKYPRLFEVALHAQRISIALVPQWLAFGARITDDGGGGVNDRVWGRSPHSSIASSCTYLRLPLVCHLIESQLMHLFSRHLRLLPTAWRSLLSSTSPNLSFLTSGTTIRTMSTAMAKRLEGKTVVVTGASSGIGRSTALEFAKTAPNNLKLIITARRIDTLKELAAQIEKEVGSGVKVLPVKLDVSDPAAVRDFPKNLPDDFKQVDILVNNAGLVKGVAKAPEIAEEDMNLMFATNVTGLINMTQAILPIFKSRSAAPGFSPGSGDIINVGSIAGREPYPGGSIYCATKAAVRSFTDALRKELISTRIRVMEIDPGQVETEFSVVRFYGDKSKADAVYAGCEPLTPEDIAEVVVFAAGRRENVVLADSLIFPNHQVSRIAISLRCTADVMKRRRLRLCIRRTHRKRADELLGWYWWGDVQEARTVEAVTVDITSARKVGGACSVSMHYAMVVL